MFAHGGYRLCRNVQGRTSMRVSLLAPSAPVGDAVGRQLAEKVAFFLDRGADVRLFVESDARLHPTLKPYTYRVEPRRASAFVEFVATSDLLVVEYSRY